MGSNTSILESNNNSDSPTTWQLDIDFHPLRVFRNSLGQYKIDEFVEFPQQQYRHQIQTYHQRLSLNVQKPISQIYSVTPVAGSCCTSNRTLKIQLQYCIKLSQISVVDQNDMFYLILSMLYGYGELHKLTSNYVHVTQETVGVNMSGQLRIWTCQNFALNSHGIILADSEKLLIKRIFTLVTSNPHKYRLPNGFLQHLHSSKKDTFTEAVVAVKSFARLNSFRVPLRLESVNHKTLLESRNKEISHLLDKSGARSRKQSLRHSKTPVKAERGNIKLGGQTYKKVVEKNIVQVAEIKRTAPIKSVSTPYEHFFVSANSQQFDPIIQNTPQKPEINIQYHTPVKRVRNDDGGFMASTAMGYTMNTANLKSEERESVCNTQNNEMDGSIHIYEPRPSNLSMNFLKNLARGSQQCSNSG